VRIQVLVVIYYSYTFNFILLIDLVYW